MPNFSFTIEIVFTLILALAGGVMARKLRLPLIAGYVLAGVVGGSFFPVLKYSQGVSTLADVGVAFLLFALGLEFSLHRLDRVRKIALYGGILQILATTFWGLLLFSFFGTSLYEALFLGSVFSLSSTAVVVKILSDRGELDTLPGEIMVGWLVVQDLVVLPLAILLPTISSFWVAQPTFFSAIGQISIALLKALAILGIVLILGKHGMPLLLKQISRLNSRELLLLAVSGLCLTAALITYSLGLSFALGAFLAGVLIAETSSRHAVFGEIRPLRDVFSIIFFVSLGAFFNFSFLLSFLPTVIFLSMAILIMKFLIVFLITLYFGYHLKTAFFASLGIFQVGEFAFLLARSELMTGHITNETYSLVLSTTMLTIIATPFVFSMLPRTYVFLERYFFSKVNFFLPFLRRKETFEKTKGFSDHVILCGFGRVGKQVGRALSACKIPFIVIDYNHVVVSTLREQGDNIIYGDPAEIEVLKAANIQSAKAVVIAIPDRYSQEVITFSALSLNPHVIILCRSHFDEDRERLLANGVNFVIQPEFEAGLAIAGRLLSIYNCSRSEIVALLGQIRREHR